MRILYLPCHSILEYDTLSLFYSLGHDVFSLGSYMDPSHPHDPKRPPLAVQFHDGLRPAVQGSQPHPDLASVVKLDSRENLQGELVDWAEVVYADGYPKEWIGANWDKIKPPHKRVIWRAIGQSNPTQERYVGELRAKGLEVMRYSPAERKFFEPKGAWGGEDALIRFHKDPKDWWGWTGERAEVGNIAQHDAIAHNRDAFINWGYLEEATKGLPKSFAGPNSEKIGGLGCISYDDMRVYLRSLRAYIYTGTQPASYTLGLIEAMLTGVPVVSIGAGWMWNPGLFEAHELARHAFDDPCEARARLSKFLDAPDHQESAATRTRAIELFGIETIREQWREFLG